MQESTPNNDFLNDGDFLFFVAKLPENLQSVNPWDLRHIWGIAKENARIAANLETRRDDLKAIFVTAMRELVANDLTFADLVAFERALLDRPVFPYNAPDYVLPKGYRRADRESDAENAE